MPFDETYQGMELSTRILIAAAVRRGIAVELLDKEDNFIRLKRGTHVEYIKQATRTAADTYIAPLIMENKEVTKILLNEAGIRVPQGITAKTPVEALAAFPRFMGKGVVIKPKSTNFGKGITILKESYSRSDFESAVKLAFKYDNFIIIEEFIAGKEYRFLVIGDDVPAILHRVPANVKGDGNHTIRELIAIKNDDPLRGTGYVTPLEKIRPGVVEEEYLKAQGRTLEDIPEQDTVVYLRENSNISTGGDSIDFTDMIPKAYKAIAVKAARTAGARICGADIMIEDIAIPPNPQNYGVIELNFNPALHIHNYPYQGENRHVEEKVLDLLGF